MDFLSFGIIGGSGRMGGPTFGQRRKGVTLNAAPYGGTHFRLRSNAECTKGIYDICNNNNNNNRLYSTPDTPQAGVQRHHTGMRGAGVAPVGCQP